jgi:hypothetical protein
MITLSKIFSRHHSPKGFIFVTAPLSRICNSARNTGQFAIADYRIANPAMFRAAIQLPLNGVIWQSPVSVVPDGENASLTSGTGILLKIDNP